MEFDKKTIGKRIKYFRENAGYSQIEFANLLGIKNNTLSQYENGDRSIDDNIKFAICKILNLEPNDLFAYQQSTKGIKIPVLGYVVAGIPIEAIQEILDYEEITPELASTGEFFALKVKGASMEPRICEDDVVIVRKQSNVENGETAVVLVNGDEATVKKIRINKNGITLVANNVSVYEPHFYTNEEVKSLPIHIIGKVVELRAKNKF